MTDYVTIDEFKVTSELVGFNFADYDAQIALTAAARGIDEYTGRFFYQSSGTQAMVYEWYGDACLPVNDITTLASVGVDYDRDGVYETAWTQGTSFVLSPYNVAFVSKPYEELELLPVAYYRRPYPYPAFVKVTATFGWPAVPLPVKQATTIMATRLLKRAREAPFGVVGLGIDSTAVRISRVDPDVAFLLDPFVKGKGVMAA